MRHGPEPLAIEQTLVPNASNVSDTFEPAFDPDVMASSEEAVQSSTCSHDLAKRHRVKLSLVDASMLGSLWAFVDDDDPIFSRLMAHTCRPPHRVTCLWRDVFLHLWSSMSRSLVPVMPLDPACIAKRRDRNTVQQQELGQMDMTPRTSRLFSRSSQMIWKVPELRRAGCVDNCVASHHKVS